MSARRRTRPGAFALGLVALVLFTGILSLTWTPIHRSPVEISDYPDPALSPDLDAIFLAGRLEGATFVVTLSVAGLVQSSGYDVFILGQESAHAGTHVYRLEYQFEEEESYGIPAFRDGARLTFLFPLRLLIQGAYIVGLEAMTWPPNGNDYVREGPREIQHVRRLLVLPFDSNLLVVATVTLASAVLLSQSGARTWLRRINGHP